MPDFNPPRSIPPQKNRDRARRRRDETYAQEYDRLHPYRSPITPFTHPPAAPPKDDVTPRNS